MPQFPLALAIEPRLLPHAVANGFSMDYKVLTGHHFLPATLRLNWIVSIAILCSEKCSNGQRP